MYRKGAIRPALVFTNVYYEMLVGCNMNESVECRECLELCIKLLSMLEQDSKDLSVSLQGDVLDTYNYIVDEEPNQLKNVRALLRSALEQFEQF